MRIFRFGELVRYLWKLFTSFKKQTNVRTSVKACIDTKGFRSPMYCEHANEVPMVCPCDDDCYCKSHTCKGS